MSKQIFKMSRDQFEAAFDIGVQGMIEQIVLISANAKGRRLVEELWPDVEWEADELTQEHSPDWLLTLPAHLERRRPLALASVDLVGGAVAMSLQRLADPRRVCHFSFSVYDLLEIGIYDIAIRDRKYSKELFAEYVPTDSIIGVESVN